MKYYLIGQIYWDWYFEYHFSPFVSDLINFIDEFIFDVQESCPMSIEHQLISILPKGSLNLLRKPFDKFEDNSILAINKLFPETIEKDMNGKLVDWQCVILIPIVSQSAVDEAIDYCCSELGGILSEFGDVCRYHPLEHDFCLHKSFNDSISANIRYF